MIKNLAESLLNIRFVRFCLVGATNGLIYFLVLMALNALTTIPISASNALAYIVAIPTSFFLHKILVFRSDEKIIKEAGPYIIVHLINIAVTSLLITWLVDRVGLHYFIGAAAVIATVPILTYLSMKYLVFRRGLDSKV